LALGLVKVRVSRMCGTKLHTSRSVSTSTGIMHVLGIWVQTSEGAKVWASVCAELATRGALASQPQARTIASELRGTGST
jgi:transposase-like protein